MDFILKKINNALSVSDPGSYDYITYFPFASKEKFS